VISGTNPAVATNRHLPLLYSVNAVFLLMMMNRISFIDSIVTHVFLHVVLRGDGDLLLFYIVVFLTFFVNKSCFF